MKGITLETMATAWMQASAEQRTNAFRALKGENPDRAYNTRIHRWSEAAKHLGVCVRTLRSWVKVSDVVPVRLPGRKRSYGIRDRDLHDLAFR